MQTEPQRRRCSNAIQISFLPGGVDPGDDGSVALEQRLQGEPGLQDIPGGAAPGLHSREPLRVLPMAPFHPTFIASPSLNRIEQRLRCGWVCRNMTRTPSGEKR